MCFSAYASECRPPSTITSMQSSESARRQKWHASLPFVFTLTARAENSLVGRPDLRDAIKLLQAYKQAGADVLYAPGLSIKNDVVSVVSSVDRPVNVVMGLQGVQLSLAELSGIGVKRVSVGSALARRPWCLSSCLPRDERAWHRFAEVASAIGISAPCSRRDARHKIRTEECSGERDLRTGTESKCRHIFSQPRHPERSSSLGSWNPK